MGISWPRHRDGHTITAVMLPTEMSKSGHHSLNLNIQPDFYSNSNAQTAPEFSNPKSALKQQVSLNNLVRKKLRILLSSGHSRVF